jgi:hypothetical protein
MREQMIISAMPFDASTIGQSFHWSETERFESAVHSASDAPWRLSEREKAEKNQRVEMW